MPKRTERTDRTHELAMYIVPIHKTKFDNLFDI